MAEDLNCEESDYKSDRADSVGSSKSKCLSCEFHRLKVAALDQKQQTLPPLNHSSGSTDSSDLQTKNQ